MIEEKAILSEKELNAIMYTQNKVIFGLRKIRELFSEDKTGLNSEYAIAETYVLQGRIAAMNDYITRRIALEVGADVKQRLSAKDLKIQAQTAMVG